MPRFKMREFRFNRRLLGLATAALVVIAGVVIVLANQNADRDFPLSMAITTSPQEGMRQLDDIFPSGEMEDVRMKLRTHRNVANAFLVNAADEKDALIASAGVLFGSQSPNTAVPINTPTSKRGSHWLVAYLGLGPSYPTAFVIEKLSTIADKIRLTFRKAKATDSTADIHHYYYWLPLGKLTPGTYHIELYDSDLDDVMLSRRIEVRE